MYTAPLPEIDSLLNRFLMQLRATFGPRLTGLYLHGSLATGDFNTARSDIDFVVITEEPPSQADFLALQGFHARLVADRVPWADHLEGAYLPRAAARRFLPDQPPYPWLSVGGSLNWEPFGVDWLIQLFVLCEQGIAVSGPPPADLIDPIPGETVREAARATLVTWWIPQLTDHTRLQSREYQVYAALTMCRILYTIEVGAVTSKPKAVHWAKTVLPSRWHPLVDEALLWPAGVQPDRLEETLAFIKFTRERGV